MTLNLRATIFDGYSLSIKGSYLLFDYNLTIDALSNASSTVNVVTKDSITAGDYICIKIVNTNTIIYYGQIITVDGDNISRNKKLTLNYFINTINGEIIINSISGNSYEDHIIRIINKYIESNSQHSIFSHSLTSTTATPFSVTKSNGLGSSNFIDYIIRGFKLHNVILNIDTLDIITSSSIPSYYPVINVLRNTKKLKFDNVLYGFDDWEVTDSRGLRGYSNELWIVDKNSSSMESPLVLKKYWLTKDGNITDTLDSGVFTPTQVHIYIYDSNATDKLSFNDIATNELSGNLYTHNIEFYIPINNNFIKLQDLQLGILSDIYYNGMLYKSVLSGYSVSQSDSRIKLTFGNLRFGKNDLFK